MECEVRMMTNKEMLEMRMNGKTFQEIADACGISKQGVHERLKLYAKRLAGIRGQGFDISTIKYEGLYEYFEENLEESLYSFAIKIGMGKDGGRVATIRNFLTGKHHSRFSIPQIKKMCEVCGKPFEEVFKERDV